MMGVAKTRKGLPGAVERGAPARCRGSIARSYGATPVPRASSTAPGPRPAAERTAWQWGRAARQCARTPLGVLERFGTATLVEAKLETGRTHQIRVHLRARHPGSGNPVYGVAPESREHPPVRRRLAVAGSRSSAAGPARAEWSDSSRYRGGGCASSRPPEDFTRAARGAAGVPGIGAS